MSAKKNEVYFGIFYSLIRDFFVEISGFLFPVDVCKLLAAGFGAVKAVMSDVF